MIRLYDTASRKKVALPQRDSGKLSIYVCGPTVYGPPHLGHGRHVLVYDILRRYLSWSGLDVYFVSNITDIDDKIINRANSEGRNWAEVAKECEKQWWDALDKLNVLRPDETPHATDYVEQMVDVIAELLTAESAYVTSDGVYLATERVANYGLLANQLLENLVEGGGDRNVVGNEKQHGADFALWKFTDGKEVGAGEPSWPSPWGEGRPGWHTECVVMSLDLLGEGFDLHTGGLDLAFPHHENERAQAEALGQDFASHWMHHGFVELEGEKMSKSTGNVMNLAGLIDRYDPRAYRLLILQSHYRSPMEVTEKTLQNAQSALERLDAFVRRSVCNADAEAQPDVIAAFRNAMDNDLDTPKAVDLMFSQVREANTAGDSGEADRSELCAATALEIAETLGLALGTGVQEAIPADVQQLAEQRFAARAAKDFDTADRLRDRLTEAGWRVEDSAAGPVISRLT